MASSVTSSTASSDSASESSSDHPASPTTPLFQHQNGVCDVEKPPALDPFADMDSKEYVERFSKYEADYTARLMAKYFSDKDVYGDKIFENSVTTVDGETIKSSRFHCAQSYADPIQYLKDKKAAAEVEASCGAPPQPHSMDEGGGSSLTVEPPANTPPPPSGGVQNGNPPIMMEKRNVS